MNEVQIHTLMHPFSAYYENISQWAHTAGTSIILAYYLISHRYCFIKRTLICIGIQLWWYVLRNSCSNGFCCCIITATIHGAFEDWALSSPSHTVTGSGTSPGSSGTEYWPTSLETDCGPHRADNADRWHTQTVCLLAGMISCERKYQSCSAHGRNPFHWHLFKQNIGWEHVYCRLFHRRILHN